MILFSVYCWSTGNHIYFSIELFSLVPSHLANLSFDLFQTEENADLFVVVNISSSEYRVVFSSPFIRWFVRLSVFL